jgi:hypothetical protein
MNQPQFDFDGKTYVPERDRPRLNAQLVRVARVMADERWRTLAEIERACGDPQSSVSARLRDLRKPRFGSSDVERRTRGEAKRGLHEYRVTLSRAARAVVVGEPS